MIFGSSCLRGATTLGSVFVLAMAIGCGSSSDSSGTGGTTGNSAGGNSAGGNSGGAGPSGGSGNAVAGAANGQAGTTSGGANNSETGGSSGDEGGAGGDDNSSGGASEGGQSGGEGGDDSGGQGGGSGETPDAWTACTDSNECVLTPMTCCGSCGAVTPEDAAAVNAQYLEEFRDAACGGPSICPACIMDDDPRVSTYCGDNGHCVVDLALD